MMTGGICAACQYQPFEGVHICLCFWMNRSELVKSPRHGIGSNFILFFSTRGEPSMVTDLECYFIPCPFRKNCSFGLRLLVARDMEGGDDFTINYRSVDDHYQKGGTTLFSFQIISATTTSNELMYSLVKAREMD